MTPAFLAKVDGPWPLIIFVLVVAFQVGSALWQRLRSATASTEPDEIPGFPPMQPPMRPPNTRAHGMPAGGSPSFGGFMPLTEAERAERLERQLRGGGAWRGVPPPALEPPPLFYETSRESGPGPSTENWVTLDGAAAAMQEAHANLARAGALATESPPPLRRASASLAEATVRLTAADAAITHPHALRASGSRAGESTGRSAPAGLAADLARSFREPATARGAVIASILLGRPKAFED